MRENIKIGLAMSGGGARGIAHIGVIQALEEHGIRAHALSGASAGSITGVLYASGMRPKEMMDFVRDSSFWKIFQVGLPTDGLAKLSYLHERLQEVIREDDFTSLQKQLFVAVTNLNQGVSEIRSSGELFKTVMASCSIPLVFKPVEMQGALYVDGGLLNNLPVEPLRQCCDLVIGVNVMPNIPVPSKVLQNALGIALRTFELSVFANTLPSLALCDALIEPLALHGYHIFQFQKHQELFEIGYNSAIAKMDSILAMVEHVAVSA